MRKITHYSLEKESVDDMCNAQRFNPCLEITFRDSSGIHTHKISAGYRDDIYVYRDNGQTYVFTQNSYLGYVGLEVFNGSEQAVDLFMEYHNLIEVICRCDLAPFTMIRRLKEYVNL